MSAFLCSPRHISMLVNAARTARIEHHELERYLPVAARQTLYEVQSPQEALFGELLQTNLDSISYRYPESATIEDWFEGGESNFIFDPHAIPTKIVAAIKLAQCYEYQSCEHEGWNDSAAKKYIDALVSGLIHELPGYESAAWSV